MTRIGRDVFKPYDSKKAPLADWHTINRAWSENPLPADRDRDLVKLFKEIGVGPSFSADSLDKLPEPIKKGLIRAAATARPMINQMLATGAYKSKIVNGWNYPPESFGSAGLAGDFVTRAAIQSLGGIIANDPVEAVYMNTFVDVKGKTLQGGKSYVINFDKDTVPPVKEFFSMTLYGLDSNFIANDIQRYAVGDKTKGLTKNADGSVTIYMQPNAPTDPAKKANWLPSPKAGAGNFYLILRAYAPKQPLIDQAWIPPAVTPVN
ncbi:DUF1254 domain-containing protein [Vibrio sp. S11_S32]|uniref:DUF1214 domain-containing protein n=1 Tax=Vibrio sp. S11_S32 TaxID=2720225 RepID=UPI00167FEB41|nr:DUF1214 domain-containing protein [Vibrio sp. S11_S32]MBD1577626.1 DUF1254 domain-containing protein [Vibrio sp. S11_S32]